MTKKALSRINRVLRYDAVTWNIGFSDCSPGQLIETGQLSEIRWVKHNYKNRWFADPFILKVTNKEYDILVEEMDTKVNRGRISRMIVNRDNMRIKSLTALLELPTHLSFPHIIFKDGEIYFYPENAEAKTLDLYSISLESNKVEKVKTLISGERLVDAQMLEINGKNYILGTIKPYQSKDTVTVFESDRWDGEYKKVKTFQVEAASARGAGEIFKCNGKLIRPAQDSAKRYGNGVVLSEIIYKNGMFISNEIRRIYPSNRFQYKDGLHTVNFYENRIAVIDAYYFNKPLLALTINKIRRFLK